MKNQKSREVLYFKVPVFLVDWMIHICILCLLAYLYPKYLGNLSTENFHWGLYSMLTVSFASAIGFMRIKLHERRIVLAIVVWRAILQTLITYVFFTTLVALTYKVVPRHLIVLEFCITLPLVIVFHFFMNKVVRWLRQLGRNTRKAVMIGADVTSVRMYKELIKGQAFTGYKVAGFFTSLEDFVLPERANYLGKISECYEWLKKHKPDEVYCSLPPATCAKEVNSIIQICNDNFMEFYFVPTMDGYPHRSMNIGHIGRVSYMSLREEPMNNVLAKLYKRTFDLMVSGIFLCTVFPFVYLFVFIGTKLSSPGPIFFKQARTGYNGKSFPIYKFRSMKVNVDADKLQATKDDPRKTKFGDFLRKSSIDELPQFINVFKGDMSIIGPRPHMEYHTEYYSDLISNYMVRHLAKPGITGWAQINGCRGETKTVEEMADRVEHDIWYIEHWTPLLDLEIFFKTMWQVIPGHDKQAY